MFSGRKLPDGPSSNSRYVYDPKAREAIERGEESARIFSVASVPSTEMAPVDATVAPSASEPRLTFIAAFAGTAPSVSVPGPDFVKPPARLQSMDAVPTASMFVTDNVPVPVLASMS